MMFHLGGWGTPEAYSAKEHNLLAWALQVYVKILTLRAGEETPQSLINRKKNRMANVEIHAGTWWRISADSQKTIKLAICKDQENSE